MAVTRNGRMFQMDAANDVLDQATIGHFLGGTPLAAGRPYKLNVVAIYIVWAAAATAVVLKNGGTGGITFFNSPGTANTTTMLSYTNNTVFDDLAVTTLPAGATVVVQVE